MTRWIILAKEPGCREAAIVRLWPEAIKYGRTETGIIAIGFRPSSIVDYNI